MNYDRIEHYELDEIEASIGREIESLGSVVAQMGSEERFCVIRDSEPTYRWVRHLRRLRKLLVVERLLEEIVHDLKDQHYGGKGAENGSDKT